MMGDTDGESRRETSNSTVLEKELLSKVSLLLIRTQETTLY